MLRIRNPHLLRLVAGGLMFAILASGCSVVLTQGPPKPGEGDYDATGAYPDGVPCTSSRMWPLVDLGLMLWVLALTVNYDSRDDQIDGSGGRDLDMDRLPAHEGVPGCTVGGGRASVAPPVTAAPSPKRSTDRA